MSIKYPCYIEFSDSGKVARLVHKNGIHLATLLIHGPFADRTLAAHTHACRCGHSNLSHSPNGPCDKCRDCRSYQEREHMPFEAEVWGLSNYERIDPTNEIVVETVTRAENGASNRKL